LGKEDFMDDLNIKDEALTKFKPFLDVVLNKYKDKIHSIHITGSALTEDFNPNSSDINSIIVLNKMDLKFLEDFAPLGKKFGKKQVSSPLIMTPEYISTSLDVFPVEFLTIKMLHKTVFGEDIFSDLEIKKSDLRPQCERELKVRLIGLRQGYLSSLGNRKFLADGFISSFSGYIPLFRGIILLLGTTPPEENEEVLTTLHDVSGVNTDVFKTVLKAKKDKTKLSIEILNSIFEDYYKAIEQLGNITDEIKA
jgi:predicted nucleotidyltransferase